MSKESRSLLPIVILIASLGLIAIAWYKLNRMPDSPYPNIQPQFSLQSASGPVSLADLKGKVSVIFFGYTHCPDVCPATLARLGKTLDLLDESEKAKVKMVFISIDPKRDTPETVAKYVHFFHPDITGLSGSRESLQAAAKSFFVGRQKNKPNAAGNYTFTHSTFIFLLRPDGKIGELLGHASKPADTAKAVRRWLKWAD